jgi:hypothetical protein
MAQVRHQFGYSRTKWKVRYGGLGAFEIRRMRELEANSPLKRMYAEFSLENGAPKGSDHKTV